MSWLLHWHISPSSGCYWYCMVSILHFWMRLDLHGNSIPLDALGIAGILSPSFGCYLYFIWLYYPILGALGVVWGLASGSISLFWMLFVLHGGSITPFWMLLEQHASLLPYSVFSGYCTVFYCSLLITYGTTQEAITTFWILYLLHGYLLPSSVYLGYCIKIYGHMVSLTYFWIVLILYWELQGDPRALLNTKALESFGYCKGIYHPLHDSLGTTHGSANLLCVIWVLDSYLSHSPQCWYAKRKWLPSSGCLLHSIAGVEGGVLCPLLNVYLLPSSGTCWYSMECITL